MQVAMELDNCNHHTSSSSIFEIVTLFMLQEREGKIKLLGHFGRKSSTLSGHHTAICLLKGEESSW